VDLEETILKVDGCARLPQTGHTVAGNRMRMNQGERRGASDGASRCTRTPLPHLPRGPPRTPHRGSGERLGLIEVKDLASIEASSEL